MKITEMLVDNKTVRPYRALKEIRGLVVHYVGCSCRSARQLRNSLQNSTREASYQYCIDYDSGEIIRCLPEEEEAWHVGASESLYTAQKRKICGSENPNRYLVGIECCVPSIEDCEPSAVQRKVLAEFCADFLKRHNLSTDKLYLHHDIVEKNCHKWFVEHPDDWLKFKGEVLALMDLPSQEASPAPSGNIYRVRKSWADEASQKGAFASLENAVKLAKSMGLKVYDGNGKQVYPAGQKTDSTPSDLEATSKFKAGDTVRVLKAEVYGGGSFKVYGDTYEVLQVSGDRVVIGLNGVVTAAVDAKNLEKVSCESSSATNAAALKKGDTVKVLKNQVYGGGTFKVYYDSYEVLQISGDRAVIGVNNVVTAAVNVKNLRKV